MLTFNCAAREQNRRIIPWLGYSGYLRYNSVTSVRKRRTLKHSEKIIKRQKELKKKKKKRKERAVRRVLKVQEIGQQGDVTSCICTLGQSNRLAHWVKWCMTTCAQSQPCLRINCSVTCVGNHTSSAWLHLKHVRNFSRALYCALQTGISLRCDFMSAPVCPFLLFNTGSRALQPGSALLLQMNCSGQSLEKVICCE